MVIEGCGLVLKISCGWPLGIAFRAVTPKVRVGRLLRVIDLEIYRPKDKKLGV